MSGSRVQRLLQLVRLQRLAQLLEQCLPPLVKRQHKPL
jgi:hypothetical protein